MSEFQELIDALVTFRDQRDWQQFHDTKNLAVALSIEAAELNELFLWKDVKDSEQVDKEKIKEELADVFAYAFLIAIVVICLIVSMVNGSVVFAYAIIFVVRLSKLRKIAVAFPCFIDTVNTV